MFYIWALHKIKQRKQTKTAVCKVTLPWGRWCSIKQRSQSLVRGKRTVMENTQWPLGYISGLVILKWKQVALSHPSRWDNASELTACDCPCMVRKWQFCTLFLSYYWFRERTDAFLNMIMCNNSIREMLCVHNAEVNAEDLLDFMSHVL